MNHASNLLDDSDIPGVFLQGRIDKDRIGPSEILAGFLEDARDLFHARQNGVEPRLLGANG